jgi:5-carboxymethyl-2-hydroxymuconate isomerase
LLRLDVFLLADKAHEANLFVHFFLKRAGKGRRDCA